MFQCTLMSLITLILMEVQILKIQGSAIQHLVCHIVYDCNKHDLVHLANFIITHCCSRYPSITRPVTCKLKKQKLIQNQSRISVRLSYSIILYSSCVSLTATHSYLFNCVSVMCCQILEHFLLAVSACS